MNLNISHSFNNVSFGREYIYKGQVVPDKQDNTHDVLHIFLEDQLGPYFLYMDQIAKEKQMPIRGLHIREASNLERENFASKKNEETEVDLNKLNGLKIYAFRERRKNELYSGETLFREPEKIQALKEAGIKSVFSLIPNDMYQEIVEKNGMHYYSLFDDGISSFDISGSLLKDLINNPSCFAKQNHSETDKLAGVHHFIDILNGDDKNMPLPIYFGCQCGTDRTFEWYQLYLILKDLPKDEPIPPEAVTKLAELYEISAGPY